MYSSSKLFYSLVAFQHDIQSARRMAAEGRKNGKRANTSSLAYERGECSGTSELKLSAGVEIAFLGTGSAQPSKYRKVFLFFSQPLFMTMSLRLLGFY